MQDHISIEEQRAVLWIVYFRIKVAVANIELALKEIEDKEKFRWN